LMARMRAAIEAGTFDTMAAQVVALWTDDP
jgi:hypothetical protein